MKRIVVAVALTLFLFAAAATAQFTEWSEPVNLGPVVNSPYLDSCVTVSRNGLTLIFGSTRWNNNANGAWHLFVSKRARISEPWGPPQEITGFNDGYHTACPALSPDEHRLYFASSARPDGCGGNDLWVSRRPDRNDDFGWGPPVNLGCDVNSTAGENVPTVFEDEDGTEVLYFSSSRSGGGDIYESRMRNDGTFGPATLAAELNSPFGDYVAVRRDGLEVIISRGVEGDSGNLYVATRESTEDPWPAAVLLPSMSSPAWEGGRMSYSFNGRAFYFTSDRPGGHGGRDLYVVTRERLRH